MVKLALMNRKIYPNLAIEQTWKFLKNLRILLCLVYLLEHVVRVWWFEICFWNLANFTWKNEKNRPEKTVMLWCSHFCLKDENFVNMCMCQNCLPHWNAKQKLSCHQKVSKLVKIYHWYQGTLSTSIIFLKTTFIV
jgi:hypothetical protein